MESGKGYVYILTNPSFREDWVKIGKSSRPVDVRSKEHDNTAAPLPFEILQHFTPANLIRLNTTGVYTVFLHSRVHFFPLKSRMLPEHTQDQTISATKGKFSQN